MTDVNISSRPNIASRVERLTFTRTMWFWATLLALGMFWDAFQLYSASTIALHFFAILNAKVFGAYLSAAFFGGTFTGAIFFAILGDRLGRRNVFAITLSVMGLGDLIAVLSINGAMLFTGMTIAGFGAGVQIPLNSTYAQEISPTKRRGKVNTYNLMIGFSGGTIGIFAAALLVPLNAVIPGYKILLIVMVIGAFSSLIIRSLLPESPRWLERVGKLDKADEVMTYIESKVKADLKIEKLPEPEIIPEKESKRNLLDVLFGKNYRRRTAGAWIIEFAQGFGFYGLVALVPSFFYTLGYSVFSSILYTGIVALSYPIGAAVTYPLIERMQRRSGIVIFYFLNMVFGIAFVLSGVYHSPIELIVAFGFLTEMMIFIDGPFLHTYEIEIYPTYLRSTAGGISYSFDRLGGFVAPLIGAYLIVAVASGYTIVFTIGAVMWGLCSLVGYFLTIKTTGTPLEELEV